MKKFLNALGVMSVFVILILFASCSKNSGGHVEPNPSTEPKISATAPAKVWYGESATGSVTATNATSVIASPGVVSGNVYTVSGLTSRLNVRLIASNAKGQTAETTVVADCWSPVRSLICKNGTWVLKENRYKDGNGPWSQWYTVTLCFKPEFSPEGTWIKKSCTSLPDLSPAPWSLNTSEDQLSFGTKSYKIVSLTDTEMVLEITESGQTVQERYTH